MENSNVSLLSGEVFNTLEQSGTRSLNSERKIKTIVLTGKGSSIADRNCLQKRKRKKAITNKLAAQLMNLAMKKQDFKMFRLYKRALYCQTFLTLSNDLAYTMYCKTRLCAFCCGVRKAEILNKYYPIIRTWKEPHFVTLTVKSVPSTKLKTWIEKGMLRGFGLIVEKYRKRNQRGDDFRIIGIRSLECNFNPLKRWYNPHFHVIVPDKKTAEILVEEWLQLWKSHNTNRDAQKIIKVQNIERALIEVIKYSTKIYTDPEGKKYTPKGLPRFIYIRAMYNIHQAMFGRRIFDRFGFDLPKSNQKVKTTFFTESSEQYSYNFKKADWQNDSDPSDLLGKEFLIDDLIELLENRINTELE